MSNFQYANPIIYTNTQVYQYLSEIQDDDDFYKIVGAFKDKINVVILLGENEGELQFQLDDQDAQSKSLQQDKVQRIEHALKKIEDALGISERNKIPKRIGKWLTNSWPSVPKAVANSTYSHRTTFSVPRFNEKGVIHLRDQFGRASTWELTQNQQGFIESVLDPNTRAVFLQAPTGAGKTLWSVWSALALLEAQQVSRIYYDRPLKGVSSEEIGFLPGGVDEKTGAYHETLREKFAEVVGIGNIEKGLKILEAMEAEGIVQRYDEIFKRGDTLYNTLLIVDEAQNKNDDQIFHLITRPDETSKVIVIGDGEFQIDLRDKRQSGFLRAREIYGNVPGVAFHEFGEEDIKRSDYVKAIYLARKEYEARKVTNDHVRQNGRVQLESNHG